jgi:hypothetical protein
MPHNWEFAPPLPDHDDQDAVFLGVGKAMTGWETIEFELSRLYSVLAGDPDGAAMRDYGTPTIARLRLDGLSEKASSLSNALQRNAKASFGQCWSAYDISPRDETRSRTALCKTSRG